MNLNKENTSIFRRKQQKQQNHSTATKLTPAYIVTDYWIETEKKYDQKTVCQPHET